MAGFFPLVVLVLHLFSSVASQVAGIGITFHSFVMLSLVFNLMMTLLPGIRINPVKF